MEATQQRERQLPQPQALHRERQEQSHRRVRRVGPIDRIALHVGVALVAWGRRPRSVPSHGYRAEQLQQQRDSLMRELAAERMYYNMITSQR